MGDFEIISAKVTECPILFDFKKQDIVGDLAGMPKVETDPFPDKGLDEVVRTEIIGHKLVLKATIKGNMTGISPAALIPYDGRQFAIVHFEIQYGAQDDEHTAEIEAECKLDRVEPLKALASLRAAFSGAPPGNSRPEPKPPYLGAVFPCSPTQSSLACVRELTASEADECTAMISDYMGVREKYSLLHVLEFNYGRLQAFVTSLKTFGAHRQVIEANSHFMNYLSAGYAAREHLKTAIGTDFGNDSDAAKKFRALLRAMEEQFFDYAFLQDFRNFVQHCGFPIGRVRLKIEKGETQLAIFYPKDVLLKKYSNWSKCNLSKRPEKEFDLLRIVTRAHFFALNEISTAIYATYGQNLPKLDLYFRGLQSQAKTIHPSAQAKLVLSHPSLLAGGILEAQDVPLDVYGELGLRRPQSP